MKTNTDAAVAELEKKADEFYEFQFRLREGACYRPTTGQEPRISWLMAAFAAEQMAEKDREIERLKAMLAKAETIGFENEEIGTVKSGKWRIWGRDGLTFDTALEAFEALAEGAKDE